MPDANAANAAVDLRIAKTLLTEAATRLSRIEGKGGLALSVSALLGRLDEPAPLPAVTGDLFLDVHRVVRGLHAVCLARGISSERAMALTGAYSTGLKQEIEKLAEEAAR